MKKVSLSGSRRANVGKKDATASRIAGNIPCVIYGGKDQVVFEAPYNSFSSLVFSPDVQTAKISVSGKEYNTIIQEIQLHPVSLDELVRESLLRGAQRLWLEVRASNQRAQELYRRYGFRDVGLRRGYYPAGALARENAIVMSLMLSGDAPSPGRDAVD